MSSVLINPLLQTAELMGGAVPRATYKFLAEGVCSTSSRSLVVVVVFVVVVVLVRGQCADVYLNDTAT